jgi:hypothetical protein
VSGTRSPVDPVMILFKHHQSPGHQPEGLAGSVCAVVIGGGVLLIGLIALIVFVVRAIFAKDD